MLEFVQGLQELKLAELAYLLLVTWCGSSRHGFYTFTSKKQTKKKITILNFKITLKFKYRVRKGLDNDNHTTCSELRQL
jgi:hypothetical protein